MCGPRTRVLRAGWVRCTAGLILCLTSGRNALALDLDALLFGSLDAGAATFATAGAKVGLGSLDREGYAMLASVGAGRRDERGACPCAPAGAYERALTRYTGTASAVFGRQWYFDWGVLAAYAGPEAAAEVLTDGNGYSPLPARYGLRLHGEAWVRPSEATLVQATVIAGTARDSVWSRLAWGYRLWGAYIGPEASLYADTTGYRKLNLGLHGTDFALGRYALRISAGAQVETDVRRVSPYAAVAVWTPW